MCLKATAESPRIIAQTTSFVNFDKENAIVNSKTQKTPSKAPESKIPSEEDALRALRNSDLSRFFPSESNVPWFESLFPDPVPDLDNDLIDKNTFNKLFKVVASQAKTMLKEKTNHSFSHLPKSVAAAIQNTILSSVRKSKASKCPAAVIRRATHLSAPSKTTTSNPSKRTADIKTPAAPKPSQPPKGKAQATSAKASIPKPSAQSTPSPSVPSTVSTIVQALHEASAPAFYFAADKTPTFKQLFPGTTMPKFTRVSGNIRIDSTSFHPLLTSRVKSAHTSLRAKKILVTKLPAAFMKYQTRLICRSIEKQLADQKQARSDKRESRKKDKAQSKKEVKFHPSTVPFSPSPDKTAVIPEPENDVFALRDLRSQLDAAKAECVLPANKRDSRPFHAILRNPAFKEFADIEFTYTTSSGNAKSLVFIPNSFGPETQFSLDAAAKLYQVVASRTSLTFEHALRQ